MSAEATHRQPQQPWEAVKNRATLKKRAREPYLEEASTWGFPGRSGRRVGGGNVGPGVLTVNGIGAQFIVTGPCGVLKLAVTSDC